MDEYQDADESKDAARGRYGVWCEAVTAVLSSGVVPRYEVESPAGVVVHLEARTIAEGAISTADAILAAFDKRFPEVRESANG